MMMMSSFYHRTRSVESVKKINHGAGFSKLMVRGEGDLAVEVLASSLMNFSPPSLHLWL